jgi:hypothetical protein
MKSPVASFAALIACSSWLSAQTPAPAPPPTYVPQPTYTPAQQQAYPSAQQQGYPSAQQPGYPTAQQPGYPPPGYDPAFAAAQAGTPRPSAVRQIFAGTISALLQGMSGGVVTAVSAGVSGGITNWFDRKRRPPNAMYPGAGGYPNTAYPNAQYPTTQYPASPSPTDPYSASQAPGATAYPSGQYPATPGPYSTTPGAYPATPGTYPTTPGTYSTSTPAYPGQITSTDPTQPTYSTQSPYGQQPGQYATQPYGTGATATDPYTASTQYYDPRTGQTVASNSTPYAPGADASALYAGVAYEVHAMRPDGSTMPVNAATYEFHTGDRFLVHFRPSLPGRMEVYNINPLGRQTRIDSVNMAAGQLTTLGPYQFAATQGDESLRLVLSPCGNEGLYAQTRDIVNVSGGTPAGALSLANCGAPTTRSVQGVKTRDIMKVAVDGTTSFALDPVTQPELSSGQLASREVTIYFHHR